MDDGNETLIRRLRDAQALSKFIGASSTFREAIATLPVAARSDAAVLITGETGTGKELAARAIHYLSERAAHPFVAVNCGSLTDSLMEDELFGHERGAFTDAQQRREGLIAQAEGGTLFLDEIDTLTARGQVVLLRVLQDRAFRPLGAQREHHAEVRFVAATNAPLTALVERGAFRADLYYRLCVFSIALPPLRERRDDIPDLVAHFLEKHRPPGAPAPRLSADAAAALLRFGWPGNVREMENVMIRAGRLAAGGVIETAHLGLPVAPAPDAALRMPRARSGSYRALKEETLRAFERDYLEQLMREAGGNVTHAARIAGKERRDLGKLLKKHGLLPKVFAPRPLPPTGSESPSAG
jgi:DNA-binding NtrC family response regulator